MSQRWLRLGNTAPNTQKHTGTSVTRACDESLQARDAEASASPRFAGVIAGILSIGTRRVTASGSASDSSSQSTDNYGMKHGRTKTICTPSLYGGVQKAVCREASCSSYQPLPQVRHHDLNGCF